MKKLKEAREIYDFKNVWISDGKIFFKDGLGNKSLFYNLCGSSWKWMDKGCIMEKEIPFSVYFWVHVGLIFFIYKNINIQYNTLN